jgi:uncharacterized membrane protein YdjX (TVP38/TMEM64 family)
MAETETNHATTDGCSSQSAPIAWWRLGALALLLVSLGLLAWTFDLHTRVTRDAIRELAGGPGGRALFVAAFCVGELLHLPGLLFVAAAVLVWGPVEGGAFAFAAGLLSLSVAFALTRLVGGQPLGVVQRPWVRRLLEKLDRRPVLTVAALRAVLAFAPPLNVALALTSLRFRDYLVGSALGLVPPVALVALFVDLGIAATR